MPTFIRPTEGYVTSGYGMRTHPIDGVVKRHHGVDIAKKGNVKIKAAADGVVVRKYRTGTFGTLGNCIIIRHQIGGKQYETLYGHLKSFTVNNGQKVKQGQLIGWMGETGGATGQHLHFEIHSPAWNNQYSGELNPFNFISEHDTLQFGYEGSAVGDLERKLKSLGYYKGAIDNMFGPALDKALREFQKAEKLTVDGYAGKGTTAKLKTASKKTEKSDITYTVKSGDTLSEIAKSQKVTMKKIMDANPAIKDKNKISVGQKIKIPK